MRVWMALMNGWWLFFCFNPMCTPPSAFRRITLGRSPRQDDSNATTCRLGWQRGHRS